MKQLQREAYRGSPHPNRWRKWLVATGGGYSRVRNVKQAWPPEYSTVLIRIGRRQIVDAIVCRENLVFVRMQRFQCIRSYAERDSGIPFRDRLKANHSVYTDGSGRVTFGLGPSLAEHA